MPSPLVPALAAALSLSLGALHGCEWLTAPPVLPGPLSCPPLATPAIAPAMPAPMAARPPTISPALRTRPINPLCR
jgi:hypothetical protein